MKIKTQKQIIDAIKRLVLKRILTLILGIFFASLTFSVSAKENNISLDIRNKPLSQVLNEIEAKSGVSFLVRSSDVDLKEKVSIKVSNESIEDVLSQLFKTTKIEFEISGKIISIFIPQEIQNNSNNPQPVNHISGVVTDNNGETILGASVIVKGTNKSTITDVNGKFSLLNISNDATLVISYVGMRSQEIKVAGKTNINVTLTNNTVLLEEVVAVGYGSQKKASITGAIATINSDKLTIAPIASTTNLLAGRLPGLITKQESGLPGSDNASLSIRGFGAPLVIVDGVESSFNNIDANEIESVTILKDASSAIYGSRAGDGVVLVTTKRGTLNKPVITLNSAKTFQGVTNLVKMGSSGQMAELSREEHLNQGLPESTSQFTQEEVDLFYAGTDPDYPNTNWLKTVARDWAPQQQHNLSVRGGSDKIKYYGFLGYLDQESMFKKNGGNYNRYNLRSNIDAKILDNLSLQLDLSSIVEKKDFPWRSDEKENSVWQEYWTTNPWYSATLPDPTKLAYGGASGAVGINATTNSNTIGYKKTDSQNIKGSISLKYDFENIKGLYAKAFANYDQDYVFWKQFNYLPDSWTYNYSNSTYTQQTTATQSTLTHNDSRNRMITGQFSLNFDRTFSEYHHLTVLALYEAIDYYSDWISASRTGYETTAIDYLFAGALANQTANGSASEMGRQSYIGRINYSYKSKYLFEGTLRVDQSAKFSKENRTGYFPSVSLGWRLSEENFIKENLPLLENLKLRTSFSQTGKDDVGNFQYLSGYEYGLKYLMGTSATQGLVETGLANPFLTWENMTIYNIGLDFGLAKQIIYGGLDVFYRDRDGIPGQRSGSLPSTFGATLPTENLNNINTRGFELTLGHEGKFRDFKWSVGANLSWSRSKWGFYDEPSYSDPDQERQNKKTGQWTDRVFGYVSDGLFTSQSEIDGLDYVYNETQGNISIKSGDIRFKDVNKDGLLNWKDKVEIGKGTTPHWEGGFNIDLSYKNFDLTALFQGAFGFYQKVVLKWGTNYSELMYNERWTPENNNRDGIIPRLGGAASNSWDSDFYYKKADYLRLKTMSLGYNLPNYFLKKINMKNLRLYAAGTNLLTFSGLNKYSIDPEAPSGYGGYYYPQMRTITFGLNLSF